jgi:hypothetical protein
MILSVNGDDSKKTIREFVDNYFLARDSRAFREHIEFAQQAAQNKRKGKKVVY